MLCCQVYGCVVDSVKYINLRVLTRMFHIQTQFCTGWRVLLLEAGPDESEASDIPVLANSMQGGLFDWQYKVGLVYSA